MKFAGYQISITHVRLNVTEAEYLHLKNSLATSHNEVHKLMATKPPFNLPAIWEQPTAEINLTPALLDTLVKTTSQVGHWPNNPDLIIINSELLTIVRELGTEWRNLNNVTGSPQHKDKRPQHKAVPIKATIKKKG